MSWFSDIVVTKLNSNLFCNISEMPNVPAMVSVGLYASISMLDMLPASFSPPFSFRGDQMDTHRHLKVSCWQYSRMHQYRTKDLITFMIIFVFMDLSMLIIILNVYLRSLVISENSWKVTLFIRLCKIIAVAKLLTWRAPEGGIKC